MVRTAEIEADGMGDAAQAGIGVSAVVALCLLSLLIGYVWRRFGEQVRTAFYYRRRM